MSSLSSNFQHKRITSFTLSLLLYAHDLKCAFTGEVTAHYSADIADGCTGMVHPGEPIVKG